MLSLSQTKWCAAIGTVLVTLIALLIGVFAAIRADSGVCEHEWENGQCLKCHEECEHPGYVGGKCYVCGKECVEHVFQDGICTVCHYQCRHEKYEDGHCAVCGMECGHERFEKGVCSVCGWECPHEEFAGGECVKCGVPCEHTRGWTEDYLCADCGYPCTHGEFADGFCTVCGKPCMYDFGKPGVCDICGYKCPHNEFEDSVCTECGYRCPHKKWLGGLCMTCLKVCDHPSHTMGGQCKDCGEYVRHTYEDSVCSVCGKHLELLTSRMTDEFFRDVPEKGTVEKIEYPSIRYEDNAEIVKKMQVYLPYGYSEKQKYNLLILCAGLGDNEEYFFTNTHYYMDGTERHFKDCLDQAIYTRVCDPLIVVNISWARDYYETEPQNWIDSPQMGQEIRDIILPYMIEHYSLYAENTEWSTMVANRDHVAMYGLSYGALLINKGIIPYCYDLIAWYTDASNASPHASAAVDKIKESGLPMRMYMCSYSSDEISKETTKTAYHDILQGCKGIVVDGYTGLELEFKDHGHSVDMFDAMVYNSLQIFF